MPDGSVVALNIGILLGLAGLEGEPSKLFNDSSCIKVHRTAGGAKAFAISIKALAAEPIIGSAQNWSFLPVR